MPKETWGLNILSSSPDENFFYTTYFYPATFKDSTSYWHGAIVLDEEVANYPGVNKLVYNLLTGHTNAVTYKDVQGGPHLNESRFNKKIRLITYNYSYAYQGETKSYIWLLLVHKTHNFNFSLMRPSIFKEHFLSHKDRLNHAASLLVNQENAFLQTIQNIDAPLAVAKKKTRTKTKACHTVALDEQQIKALDLRLPLLIYGPPGVGKTEIIKILAGKQHSTIFSNSRQLNERLNEGLTSFNSKLYKHWLARFVPLNLRRVNRRHCLEWLSEKTPKNAQLTIYKDINALYFELRMMAHLTQEQYVNGAYQSFSIFTDKHQRQEVFELCANYKNYLKAHSLYQSQFYTIEEDMLKRMHEDNTIRSVFLVDEGQRFNGIELQNLILSAPKDLEGQPEIVICYNSIQDLFSHKPTMRLVEDLLPPGHSKLPLKFSYRSDAAINAAANAFMHVDAFFSGNKDGKNFQALATPPQTTTTTTTTTSASQIDKLQPIYSLQWSQTIENLIRNHVEYVIVTLDATKKEYFSENFPNPVFTAKEIQGLEFRFIVLILGENNLLNKANTNLAPHSTSYNPNKDYEYRNPKGEGEIKFSSTFKSIIVAITRATETAIICYANEHHFKNIQKIVSDKITQQGYTLESELPDNIKLPMASREELIKMYRTIKQADSEEIKQQLEKIKKALNDRNIILPEEETTSQPKSISNTKKKNARTRKKQQLPSEKADKSDNPAPAIVAPTLPAISLAENKIEEKQPKPTLAPVPKPIFPKTKPPKKIRGTFAKQEPVINQALLSALIQVPNSTNLEKYLFNISHKFTEFSKDLDNFYEGKIVGAYEDLYKRLKYLFTTVENLGPLAAAILIHEVSTKQKKSIPFLFVVLKKYLENAASFIDNLSPEDQKEYSILWLKTYKKQCTLIRMTGKDNFENLKAPTTKTEYIIKDNKIFFLVSPH